MNAIVNSIAIIINAGTTIAAFIYINRTNARIDRITDPGLTRAEAIRLAATNRDKP